jgi:hypothetical protein
MSVTPAASAALSVTEWLDPKTPKSIGCRASAVAEGYIPPASTGETRQLTCHETICILNAGGEDAQVEVTVYFSNRAPVGPYRFKVGTKRSSHLRFNEFTDPEPVLRDTDFSSVIVSNVPIVVQHMRLDSRQTALALLSTMAFPAGSA